jgi:glycerol-3-phosphate dehydrogenase
MIQAINDVQEWDVCIIGGGATGLGAAVDAASRGYKTILFEKYDFAKGTSSRSTKLVHGGVRYLAQLNIKLVLEALNERGLMLKNAPHLVKNQSFVIPNYEWWEHSYYGIGLKAYDWMAGSLGLGPSEFLSVEETLAAVPTLDPEGLRGGIRYHDGQFDDARMAIHLAMTAVDHGGVVLNYFPVEGFIKTKDVIRGVQVKDAFSGDTYAIRAKAVINATGVFSDELRKLDDPHAEEQLSPSQGIHLVLDPDFLPVDTAILIPRTDDGRVLFAVPWHHKLIVGTTDTPMDQVTVEPKALSSEIEFILEHMRHYLTKEPKLEDIRSVFCGLRPLVKGNAKSTSSLSRDHNITISYSELISITGGKWTTYRKMAEDVVDVAVQKGQLKFVKSETVSLPIHGYKSETDFNSPLYYYGTDKPEVEKIALEHSAWTERIHPNLEYIKAEIIWSIRAEMSLTVEDVLARRTRMLFLDAHAAMESALVVATIMAGEMKRDETWIRDQVDAFRSLAIQYLPQNKSLKL